MTDAMENIPDKNLERWAQEGGPPGLRAGLSGVFGATPAISRLVDEQILAAAAEHSLRRHRMRWVIRYALGSVAAAAAVLLIAIKTSHDDRPVINNAAPAVASAEDFNRDGNIDMIDAFLMARKVADKDTVKEWDFNNDGAVDDKDVDVVAFAAVKIKGGENP